MDRPTIIRKTAADLRVPPNLADYAAARAAFNWEAARAELAGLPLHRRGRVRSGRMSPTLTYLESEHFEALAASLKAHPTVKCIIEGHTDDRGSPEVNQKLSERRAASVKAWLAKNGVAPARLSIKGFGQSYPTRSNETEAGRAANRRVEVAIVK